jgi:hypothetical protein
LAKVRKFFCGCSFDICRPIAIYFFLKIHHDPFEEKNDSFAEAFNSKPIPKEMAKNKKKHMK